MDSTQPSTCIRHVEFRVHIRTEYKTLNIKLPPQFYHRRQKQGSEQWHPLAWKHYWYQSSLSLIPLHLFLPHSSTVQPLANSTHLQLIQFGSDGDEAQVQLATKMISQPPIIVMDPQVRSTHLAHSQLLLLIAGGGHGVAELNLK